MTKRVKGSPATEGTKGTGWQGRVLDQTKAGTKASGKEVGSKLTAKLRKREGREVGIGLSRAEARKANAVRDGGSREPVLPGLGVEPGRKQRLATSRRG